MWKLSDYLKVEISWNFKRREQNSFTMDSPILGSFCSRNFITVHISKAFHQFKKEKKLLFKPKTGFLEKFNASFTTSLKSNSYRLLQWSRIIFSLPDLPQWRRECLIVLHNNDQGQPAVTENSVKKRPGLRGLKKNTLHIWLTDA